MAYHLRIKICGVTNEADACHAARCGADAVGLNFYPKSPRFLEPEKAQAILRELPPFVSAVGLFVNRRLREIARDVQELGRLAAIQWQGEERETASAVSVPLIAAFAVAAAQDLEAITRYLELCKASGKLPAAVLVDARVKGLYGGTGQTVPWNLLSEFRRDVPLILAGGLTAENVAEAVRTVRPYAVDVASGVERGPGQKDPDRVRLFIDHARAAAAGLSNEEGFVH